MSTYCVDILASRPRGTLYIGVTNDPVRRVHEHREGAADGFIRRCGVSGVVYFEATDNVAAAIQREKRLDEWQRAWKIALVLRALCHLGDPQARSSIGTNRRGCGPM